MTYLVRLSVVAITAWSVLGCGEANEDWGSGTPVMDPGPSSRDLGAGGEANAPDPPVFRDPNALVEKSHFTTFNGPAQMMPRNTHICVLTRIQGAFTEPGVIFFTSPIHREADRWDLSGSEFSATCFQHSSFFGPPGSFTMWSDVFGSVGASSAWPSCTDSQTTKSWHGDAITFISGVSAEFEGSGERVWVTQTPSFQAGQTTIGARTGVCFGQVIGGFLAYFFGIPGSTKPVFIGTGDRRLGANDSGAEFVISSFGNTATVNMARTDHAMCYLTRFSGDFNGGGERVQIAPVTINGVQRWQLQASSGLTNGASAQARARCLAFDQNQLPPSGPNG